jgi:hypothetical protein
MMLDVKSFVEETEEKERRVHNSYPRRCIMSYNLFNNLTNENCAIGKGSTGNQVESLLLLRLFSTLEQQGATMRSLLQPKSLLSPQMSHAL